LKLQDTSQEGQSKESPNRINNTSALRTRSLVSNDPRIPGEYTGVKHQKGKFQEPQTREVQKRYDKKKLTLVASGMIRYVQDKFDFGLGTGLKLKSVIVSHDALKHNMNKKDYLQS
jgi:hypothetical protein